MPRKKASCLNETKVMKNGMKATCIAYRLAKDMDVKFEDGTIVEHVQKVHFDNGTITNPNSDYNPYIRLESLEETNPELVKEWDYDKNTLLPNDITRSYNKDVWWKCELGHSWKAKVTARSRKNPTGCPYCSGNLPIEGINDFETMNPDLMLDWNYDKNQNVDPTKITAHSGEYIDWKCHFCGYEWRTRANNRSSGKRGCPNCSMKSTSFGEQAVYYYVKKIFPNAINRYRDGKFELDILIPDINTGIEFDGAYFHKGEANDSREKRKYSKCQELGIKLIRIKDSQAMGTRDNSDYTIGVDKLHNYDSLNNVIRLLLQDIDPQSNMWTRTNPFQHWSTIDSQIDVEQDYFDIVSDKFYRAEENSFIHEHPELLEDWNYELNGNVNPQSITSGSGTYFNWKCHICGYEWKARVPDRIRGDNCPCCNRNVLVKGVNDFATLYPEELLEWDYDNNTVQPDTVIAYNQKVAWKCSKCGHRWEATIQDKVIREDKTGCPKCARKLIAVKRHERAMKDGGLFDKYPELLSSWNYDKNHGVDMSDISPGSSKRFWWVCPACGYEWESSPNNRTHGGRVRGCPKCRYKTNATKDNQGHITK